MIALIHFELILIQGERHRSSLFSACRYPVFPATFEGAVFSPWYVLSKNHMGIAASIPVWPSILFHWSSCLFFWQNHSVFIAMVLQYSLTSGNWYLQYYYFCAVLPWLFKAFCISIWTLGLILLNLCDECYWNFGGDCTEHVKIDFGNIAIFTI
jgi:hypothetical protein